MKKITVIGAGHVGSSVCSAIINQNLASQVALIDLNQELVKGEVMDINDSAVLLNDKTIMKLGTYDDIGDSDCLIITAGLSQQTAKGKEGRLSGKATCLSIISSISQEISKRKYQGFIIIASNPLDIMSYYAYKLTGVDSHKVIGTGTLLDSTRLRIILADKLKVDVNSIKAMTLGEHGESQFISTSLSSVNSVPLIKYLKEYTDIKDVEGFISETEKEVKGYGFDILCKKMGTYYGVAQAVLRIIKDIDDDKKEVVPVSVYVNGQYGIKDVYLSLPSVIGKDGIEQIKEYHLNDRDLSELLMSAHKIKENI